MICMKSLNREESTYRLFLIKNLLEIIITIKIINKENALIVILEMQILISPNNNLFEVFLIDQRKKISVVYHFWLHKLNEPIRDSE